MTGSTGHLCVWHTEMTLSVFIWSLCLSAVRWMLNRGSAVAVDSLLNCRRHRTALQLCEVLRSDQTHSAKRFSNSGAITNPVWKSWSLCAFFCAACAQQYIQDQSWALHMFTEFDGLLFCLAYACLGLFTGRTPQSGVSRYLNLLSVQNSTFCPLAEKIMNWIEKLLTPFRMGTTSSATMQSLGRSYNARRL